MIDPDRRTPIEKFLGFSFKFFIVIFPIALFIAFIINTILWVRGIELPLLISWLVYGLVGACVSAWMGPLYDRIV